MAEQLTDRELASTVESNAQAWERDLTHRGDNAPLTVSDLRALLSLIGDLAAAVAQQPQK